MKFLLKTSSNNEYWDADYFLVELTDAEAIALQQQAVQCGDFLKQIGSNFYGHVAIECSMTVSAGSVEDTEPWPLLDEHGWVYVADEFSFKEEARIECICIHIFPDGEMYLHAISKYSSDTVEAQLPDAIIDLVLGPQSAIRNPQSAIP